MAIVAAARKLASLFWCLLMREQDYAYAQPSPTAKMEFPRFAGHGWAVGC